MNFLNKLPKRKHKHSCPYCGMALDVVPTRKKKCPHCGMFIYVRQGILLTEEDKNIEDWLVRVESFGVNRQTFNAHRDKLSKQFGTTASVNDTIWRILNNLVGKTRDYETLAHIYLEMAHIVQLEGKDPKQYLVEASKNQLLGYKKMGVKKVNIYTTEDDSVCKNCKKNSNKVFLIDDALRNLPVPTQCEKVDGCRCWYAPVV